MTRNIRVVFFREEGEHHHYVEVAWGTWTLGHEPVLSGEPIPPEVLTGMEKQTPVACQNTKGTIRYARGEVLYAMDFEALEESTRVA